MCDNLNIYIVIPEKTLNINGCNGKITIVPTDKKRATPVSDNNKPNINNATIPMHEFITVRNKMRNHQYFHT